MADTRELSDLSPENIEMLVNFKEITHIQSTDECKQILEAFGWNLELAVQNTFNDHQSDPLPDIRENHQFANATSALNPLSFPQAPRTPSSVSTANNLDTSTVVNAASIQRNISYHSHRQNQAVVQRTFFEWGVLIVAFPFKFVFSALIEFINFFRSFFETDPMAIQFDPLANVADHVIRFNQKYGMEHPNFYQGSYSQAVSQAKQDLKFLLVYIHQNDNNDSNSFAVETLRNKNVIDFINDTFIFWSCSKDLPEGRRVFNTLKGRRCPFLGVVVYKQSRMTLVARIEGPAKSEELITQLGNIVADNSTDLSIERLNREQRAQDQELRKQQDEAYLESLKADKEKERRKQEQLEAQKRAELEEKQKIENEKQKEIEIFKKKAEVRKWLLEIDVNDPKHTAAIKLGVKMPCGNRYERIFLKTDPINILYKFVFSNEECPINFEIYMNFPRKVINCNEESTTTLEEHGITQSMLLFVNDLDA